MLASELLDFCEAERDWVVETAIALARLESPTQDKIAVDRCGSELGERLEAIGATVETFARDETGNPVRARFGNGETQLLLLGHFDTVWPVGQLDRMPVRKNGGRLHGPGVFDMKAGIALGMLAARALSQLGLSSHKKLTMLLTADEERGSASSRALVEAEAQRSDAVLVLEPSLPGGALKTSRKGGGVFELTVHGIAAHAGVDPAKGASAIHELAEQIVEVSALQDLDRGVSVNVGFVEGGSQPNVVAERARAVIDARVATAEDASRIEAALRALLPNRSGTKLDVNGGFLRPPFERTEAVINLYKIAREVAAKLGHDLGEGTTGGGSDGNLTAALGVPTLDGLGAIGDGAHALHEHVEIAELPWRSALVAGLINRLDEA